MLVQFFPPTDTSLAAVIERFFTAGRPSAEDCPFDPLARLVDGIPDPRREPRRLLAAMEAWGFPKRRIDECMALRDEYFESIDDEGAELWNVIHRTRISKFFPDPLCPVNWARLADRHQGFCVVYEEAILISEIENWFLADVTYTNSPPVVDTFLFALACDQRDWHHMAAENEGVGPDEEHPYLESAEAAQNLMFQAWRDLFCVLPADRRHERERRLLVEATAREAELRIEYPEQAIARIIVGANMPSAYLGQLLASLSAHSRPLRVEQAALLPAAGMSTHFLAAVGGS